MSKLLKIIFLLFLLSFLGGVIWFELNLDLITAKTKLYLEEKFSKMINSQVGIGSIGYTPALFFTLKDISVYDGGSELAVAKVKTVVISPMLLRTLIDRQFMVSMHINGLRADKLSGDLVLSAGPQGIIIDQGKLKWVNDEFSNINGTLGGIVSGKIQGKVSFLYQKQKIFLNFNKIPASDNDYHITAASRDIGLRGTVFRNKDMLQIDSLKGKLFSVKTDLTGRIEDISSENKTFALKGTLSGDLENILPLLVPQKGTKDMIGIQGPFTSDIETMFNENYVDFTAYISSENLNIRKNILTDLHANVSLKDKKLNISGLKFNALGGAFLGRSEADINSPGFPFVLNISVQNIDPALLSEKIFGIEKNLRGALSSDLLFKGYFQDIAELVNDNKRNSYGEYAAALDVEVEASFSSENIVSDDMIFKDIKGDISYKNGLLKASDLNFTIFGGKVLNSFSMDIKDPSLAFTLDTRIKEIDPHLILERFTKKNKIQGNFDADLILKSSGSYLSNVIRNLHGKNVEENSPFSEKIRYLFSLVLEEKGLHDLYLQIDLFSKSLRMDKVVFDDITGKLSLDDGRLTIPYIKSDFYKGTFSSYLSADLLKKESPFSLNISVTNVDFNTFSRVWDVKSKVRGELNSTVETHGSFLNAFYLTGSGEINVLNADLGPMPLLTPLLGNIYSTVENIVPAFKKIDITSASATFDIKDRHLITNDLTMSGSDIDIIAKGSLGFDGKLDFTFENRLIVPEEEKEEESWQVSIRNFITNFGKVISKTRLKGTIQDQKWEFEYFSHMKDQIGKNIQNFFEGIMK
ncbi:MAG: AsmA-like C-terminal region-containing protein [Candidatus Omnitrophota bacterium]